MAVPAIDRITVRHKSSKATRDIARAALPFFPDYEPLPEPSQPARSASKADWVAFATEHGLSAEEAESKSRDELVAQFAPKES